jgi:4,5-DOPA dioxygenase extradiol
MNQPNRILYLSHGGGPLPLLGDANHSEMISCLKAIAREIGKPSAIVVVSAHWEESVPSITSGASPGLIYDYYGFPEESYRIQYPCPGEPTLARQISHQLADAGIEARLDDSRGFDHGLFMPLKIMYPDADIPCVQLSLVSSLDPALHIAMGKALQGLKQDNILVIGSGFSFHNMKAFFDPGNSDSAVKNEAFEEWLIHTLSSAALSEEERSQRLIHWASAPHARFCHPREEHLLPLHLCYGLAQRACSQWFEARILNKKSSLYLW